MCVNKSAYMNSIPASELRKNIKQAAKSVLSNNSAYLKLVFATLVILSAYVFLEIIQSCICWAFAVLAEYNSNVIQEVTIDLIFTVVKFFLISPLFVGAYALTIKAAQKSNVPFSTVFQYYTSLKSISKTWVVSAIINGPFTLLCITFRVFSFFYKNIAIDILYYVLALILLLIMGKFSSILNAVICGGDQKISTCIVYAIKSSRKYIWNMFVFLISFLWWICLSIVSVGILFIIFTIPYIMVSHTLYTTYILTGKYQNYDSEESYYEQQ